MIRKDKCFLCKYDIENGLGIDYFCEDCIRWSFTVEGLLYWTDLVGFVNTLVVLEMFYVGRGQNS